MFSFFLSFFILTEQIFSTTCVFPRTEGLKVQILIKSLYDLQRIVSTNRLML